MTHFLKAKIKEQYEKQVRTIHKSKSHHEEWHLMLTQERLKELLSYDQNTGDFTWLKSLNAKATTGDIAGYPNNYGYIKIQIDGKKYSAHRLVFLYVDGAFPSDDVDHINGIVGDNKLANLRKATVSENMQNQTRPQKGNKSGYLGVSIQKGKYRAKIMIDKKETHLGYFLSAKEASDAYIAAKRSLHPHTTI